MLRHIGIKNIALIEKAEIEFGEGLNILSGETGAGKSMVIDSINFVLGERTNRNFMRKGALQASVEALFIIESKEYQKLLADMGISPEEDGSILLSRSLNKSGKATNRINGQLVTAGMLSKLSESIIDIHGQHEHQSLLDPSKHILLLDRFCGEALAKKKAALEEEYCRYQEIIRAIQELSGDERQRAQKLDLLQFQKKEIKEANLKSGEEEELAEKKKRIANSEKRKRLSLECVAFLYRGGEDTLAAVDLLGRAISNLRELVRLDGELAPTLDTAAHIATLLDDICLELGRYADNVEQETDSIDEVEDRLTEIYRLKRKYGNTITEILAYFEQVEEQIQSIEQSEDRILELTKQKEAAEKKLAALCETVTEMRKKKAMQIQKEIEKQLQELEMKYAKFFIQFEKKDHFTANGWDSVEFLISANLGEELKPLAKIASGGEMSRVMLAIKTVLADVDTIETFIFDEIDTGISGRTAQRVAEKMSHMGKRHQIICITHLPQIAAMADKHFLIEKKTKQEKTTTYVKHLEEDGKIAEITRLMGGTKITQTTITAATELRTLALEYKKK